MACLFKLCNKLFHLEANYILLNCDLICAYIVLCVSVVSLNFRTELEESQQKLAELKEETSQVTDTEMTPLLDELATLQQTCVLRGDYELKQARQDYFMSKQDKVQNYYSMFHYTDI